MRRSLSVFTLAILLVAGSKKKNQELPPINKWQIFTAANSMLPENQVNAIAIDKQSTVWVGTAKGLVRKTAGEWTVFNTGNTPLVASFIHAVAVQDNGNIWVGTAAASSIAVNSNGNKWIGTVAERLLQYAPGN